MPWRFVINGGLMSAYHWHQTWMILGGMVGSILCLALPARRFRSTWMVVIIHAIEYVLFIPMILALVLGLV